MKNEICDFISPQEFATCLLLGHGSLDSYGEESIGRLHRIALSLQENKSIIKGPTLDVSSEGALLYPFLKDYLQDCLPYYVSESTERKVTVNGEEIPSVKFHCEKDILPFPDNSFGLVLFCDIIEHLCVDPMWALLEINRVLAPGGHLVVTTPNACTARNLIYVLTGSHITTCNHYTPVNQYLRHNREWTLCDLVSAFGCAGLQPMAYKTYHELLCPDGLRLIEYGRSLCPEKVRPVQEFGPEIFCLGQKVKHCTLSSDLSKDERWPKDLYSEHDCFRRRPDRFPINSIE